MKRVCPVCGREYSEYPAVSRKDNKTEICPDCGQDEAIIDWINNIGAIKANKDSLKVFKNHIDIYSESW